MLIFAQKYDIHSMAYNNYANPLLLIFQLMSFSKSPYMDAEGSSEVKDSSLVTYEVCGNVSHNNKVRMYVIIIFFNSAYIKHVLNNILIHKSIKFTVVCR